MTNKDRAMQLIIEVERLRGDRADIMAAFRAKVKALKTEAKDGEKSIADMMSDLKKRIASAEAEIVKCAQQPNQTVMDGVL